MIGQRACAPRRGLESYPIADPGARLDEIRVPVRVATTHREDLPSRGARQSVTSIAPIRSIRCLPQSCASDATGSRRGQTSSMAADSVAEPRAIV